MEEVVWDKYGKLKTFSPSTYKIPAISDTPKKFNVEIFKKGSNVENVVNKQKTTGEPPLMLALHNPAISGDQTCAGFLLGKGANPDIVSVHGWCALSITFYNSKVSDLLRLMVLLLENNDRLLQGFTNRFPMPVSRFTETRKQDLIDEDLEILAESTLSGVGMVRSRSTKDLYILNHLEYDAETLKDEYLRDKNENLNISLPENYFPDNDDQKLPVNRWRPYAFLLFANFINEVYQDVPFDFGKNN